jgi:8-oxo-dGTP pyrophosphatase MutT (NUDIX family)
MSSGLRPKAAATIILVRPDSSGAFEVLLTRRPAGMKFLGGFYVFPGGTIRAEDYGSTALSHCRGLTPEQARELLGSTLSPAFCLGHWIACVRELFEEVGVLLCAGQGAVRSAPGSAGFKDWLQAKHRALLSGGLSFEDFLQEESLLCDLSRIAYFSHWQTPSELPSRFDTRFFLAALPDGQAPLAASPEVTEISWVTPDQALALYGQYKLPIIFPTFATLRTLADFDSFEILAREYRIR